MLNRNNAMMAIGRARVVPEMCVGPKTANAGNFVSTAVALKYGI
jgi:hypothetical protein